MLKIKGVFRNILTTKGPSKISIFYWTLCGILPPRMRKRMRYLMPLSQSLTERLVILSSLTWVTDIGNRIQEEVESTLPLWQSWLCRAGRASRACLTKPFPIIYHQSWLTGVIPDEWRLVTVMRSVQEMLEGGSRKLQACQLDLGPREPYGICYLKCDDMAHTVKPGDQVQPAGF